VQAPGGYNSLIARPCMQSRTCGDKFKGAKMKGGAWREEYVVVVLNASGAWKLNIWL